MQHLQLAATAIEPLDQLADDEAVGCRAGNDQRSVGGIDANPSRRLQHIHFLHDLNQFLRIERNQSKHFNPRLHVGQAYERVARYVDPLEKLRGDHRAIRRRLDQNRVLPRIGDDRELGLLRFGRRRTATLLSPHHGHLLGLLHLLRRHLRLRFAADAEELFEQLFGLFRRNVTQTELRDERLAAGRILLLSQQLRDLPQRDRRVDRFDPVGRRQRRQLTVFAEHRLEFLGELFRRQPADLQRGADEPVRREGLEVIGSDTWDQRRIERRTFDDRQPAIEFQQRVAAGQQVAIEQVDHLGHRVAARGGDVHAVGGQFLPVQWLIRQFGQPVDQFRPSLIAKLEGDTSIGTEHSGCQFSRIALRLR